MYGLPYSCPCMRHATFRQSGNQSGYSVYKYENVYLGGIAGTERIVLYNKNSGLGSKVQIQKFDSKSNNWVTEYEKEIEGTYFLVDQGYWEAAKRNIVVLYYIIGSGGFLTYTVIGRKNNKIVELVSRKDIFQGNVWLDSGKLYEQYGNRYRVWISRKGRLILVPYRIPAIPGALVIKYGITPSGEVIIGKKNYTVPIGSSVQIIRTDLNDVSERLLSSSSKAVKFLSHKSGFQFTDKGMMDVTIIPEGYNWDKSVTVSIEAK